MFITKIIYHHALFKPVLVMLWVNHTSYDVPAAPALGNKGTLLSSLTWYTFIFNYYFPL